MAINIRFYMLAILGSLLSGVDSTLSGGLLVLTSFITTFFPHLYTSRNLQYFGTFCQYQSLKLVAIALIPCGLGWLFGFLAIRIQPKCGPRTLMIGSSALVFVGGLISITFTKFGSFLMGRIILGIGMAILRQVVPIYIVEVPPREMRNLLDILYEIFSRVGNIVGSVFIFIPIIHSNTWEWKFSAFPLMAIAACVGLASYLVPESPKYHIIRGNIDSIAQTTLAKFLEPHDVQLEYERLLQEVADLEGVNQFNEIIREINTPYLRIKTISIALQSFLGSSTLLSFLPGFLVGLGLGTKSSLFSSLSIAIISIIGMSFSVWLIERRECGRRMILLTGCFLMTFAQSCLGSLIIHYVNSYYELADVTVVVVVTLICIFVFTSAMLPGPLGWLAVNYPAMTRMPGTFLSRNTNSTVDFFLSQVFLFIMCYLHGWLWIVFAVASIIMFFFIYFFIPETTGLTFGEMTEVWRGHWYWSQFVPSPVNEAELLEVA